jgi:hypothetical protein
MDKHISWLDAEERELEKKVEADYSVDEVRKHLEYLTTLTRMAGTGDELKAAHYIKGKLDEYGVDSEIYEFDAYISHPGKAELEVLSPVQKFLSCLPWIFITPTPPEGIEAELISVGKGWDKDYQGVDVRGKIVLVEPGAREVRVEAAQKAEERGAAAQIHITRGKRRAINFGQTRNTWGSPTQETIGKVPKTPAVAICSEDGSYLEELTRKGAVVVRLEADAWRGYKKIRLPVGTLEGMREPEKYVLLAGHYCSWFIGATDNAAANSLMLEMARIFSKHRKHLGRGIKFAWWSGHEQGAYAGSTWYLDTFWDDIRDNAIAYVVMDGIGRIGSSGFDPRDTEEIRKFYEGIIKDVLGLEAKSKRVLKSGDQSYLGVGLPSFKGKPGFAAEQTGGIDVDPVWYGHTAEDTLDKVDMDLIRIPFRVNAVSILRLCNNPVLPFDFVTVAEAFADGLNDLQKASKSGLDMTSLMRHAEALRKNVEALNKTMDENLSAYEKNRRDAGLEGKFKEINACLMELGRILMPVLSTKTGKYGQDPMGTKFRPIPVLQPLKNLNDMDSDSEVYKALHTSLVRERNKVSDTLNLANRILANTLGRI